MTRFYFITLIIYLCTGVRGLESIPGVAITPAIFAKKISRTSKSRIGRASSPQQPAKKRFSYNTQDSWKLASCDVSDGLESCYDVLTKSYTCIPSGSTCCANGDYCSSDEYCYGNDCYSQAQSLASCGFDAQECYVYKSESNPPTSGSECGDLDTTCCGNGYECANGYSCQPYPYCCVQGYIYCPDDVAGYGACMADGNTCCYNGYSCPYGYSCDGNLCCPSSDPEACVPPDSISSLPPGTSPVASFAPITRFPSVKPIIPPVMTYSPVPPPVSTGTPVSPISPPVSTGTPVSPISPPVSTGTPVSPIPPPINNPPFSPPFFSTDDPTIQPTFSIQDMTLPPNTPPVPDFSLSPNSFPPAPDFSLSPNSFPPAPDFSLSPNSFPPAPDFSLSPNSFPPAPDFSLSPSMPVPEVTFPPNFPNIPTTPYPSNPLAPVETNAPTVHPTNSTGPKTDSTDSNLAMLSTTAIIGIAASLGVLLCLCCIGCFYYVFIYREKLTNESKMAYWIGNRGNNANITIMKNEMEKDGRSVSTQSAYVSQAHAYPSSESYNSPVTNPMQSAPPKSGAAPPYEDFY